MKDDEIVEVCGLLKHETDSAILLEIDGYDVWLPKSKIEYYGDVGEEIDVYMEDWLAYDKGLC